MLIDDDYRLNLSSIKDLAKKEGASRGVEISEEEDGEEGEEGEEEGGRAEGHGGQPVGLLVLQAQAPPTAIRPL